MIVTGALTVTFPAASRATAASVCVPSGTVALFQTMVGAATVEAVPTSLPSTRKYTAATPTLSEARAESWTVPEIRAPGAGATRVTVGESYLHLVLGHWGLVYSDMPMSLLGHQPHSKRPLLR